MALFLDKAFTLIFLLCSILSLPVSVLIFATFSKEVLNEFKEKNSILMTLILMIILLLIIIVEVSFFVGMSYLIYKMVLVLLSSRIVFFNI